jgi:hypothetical protein
MRRWRAEVLGGVSSSQLACRAEAGTVFIRLGVSGKKRGPGERSRIEQTQRAILSARQDVTSGESSVGLDHWLGFWTVEGDRGEEREGKGEGAGHWLESQGVIVMKRRKHSAIFWKKEMTCWMSAWLSQIPEQALEIGQKKK